MCTIVDYNLRVNRARCLHPVIFPLMVGAPKYNSMHLWLADFENGTSGFVAIQHSVARHHVEKGLHGSKAFEDVTAFWFSNPDTAFAFKVRWG